MFDSKTVRSAVIAGTLAMIACRDGCFFCVQGALSSEMRRLGSTNDGVR